MKKKNIKSFGTEPHPKAFLALDREEYELMRISEEPGRRPIPDDDPRYKVLRQAAINTYIEKGVDSNPYVAKMIKEYKLLS